MKMPLNVVKFSADYGLDKLLARFADTYNHKRYNEGAKHLTFDTVDSEGKAISLDRKDAELNKMFAETVARISNTDMTTFGLAQTSSSPQVIWAFNQTVNAMIDMVLPNSIIDSTGMYTESRVAGFGDSFKFDVKPRDLFPVTKASNGKRIAELQRQFNNSVTLSAENHMITVYVSMYRVLAGLDSLADFVMKAVRSIEVEMTKDVYNAFNTAMTSLPTTPVDGELKFTGYSQSNLIKLIQRVTAYNQGSKAVILGTQLALQNILPADANYRYSLSDPYVTLGYIPNVFGADVVMLPQVADWVNPYKMVLDDTRIYVVSPGMQKIVKLCLEGGTLSYADGVYDNANLTQTSTLSRRWVAGVVTNAVSGLIVLS